MSFFERNERKPFFFLASPAPGIYQEAGSCEAEAEAEAGAVVVPR